VFSNTSQKFYLVDFKTFKVVKEIKLNVPDGVDLVGMELLKLLLFCRQWVKP